MSEINKTDLSVIEFENDISLPLNVPLIFWVSNPYLKAATSNNTRKAYQSDIKHYEQWGGLLPATSEIIIHYLQAHAKTLNSRTLSRRLVAISNWHTYQGFPDPTNHPIVSKTLTGIARVHGKPKEKAHPLSPEDLAKIIETLRKSFSLANLRDSAILQLGYFGALRRSELVSIHYENIQWKPEGIEILLTHSKTDQSNEGQYCAVPYGDNILCPVKALESWLTASSIQQGPIFRRIFKNDQVGHTALIPLSINHIVQRGAELANIPHAKNMSSHSLRRGLATYAARANVPIKAIMNAGRWKQVNTVMEYIEANERFENSAAASVLSNMKNE